MRLPRVMSEELLPACWRWPEGMLVSGIPLGVLVFGALFAIIAHVLLGNGVRTVERRAR